MHQIVQWLGEIECNDRNLHTPPQLDGRHKPFVSIVRNPADWLRSYFTNINCPIFEPVDRFLAYSRGKAEPTQAGLEQFIGDYLKGPPLVGQMFREYAADIVWRIEDMPCPIEDWLRLAPSTIPLPDRCETKNKLHLPAGMRADIRNHEKSFCEKWGY